MLKQIGLEGSGPRPMDYPKPVHPIMKLDGKHKNEYYQVKFNTLINIKNTSRIVINMKRLIINMVTIL